MVFFFIRRSVGLETDLGLHAVLQHNLIFRESSVVMAKITRASAKVHPHSR